MDAAEYGILLALAAVGGVGVPVVGDAALIAVALAAADGHLSIAVVLVAAFRGHKIGRAVAYQLGARGGRPLMERPGWFEGVRLRDLIGRIAVVEGVLFVALLAAVLLLYRYGRRRLFRAGPADSRGKADGPRASGFTK